MSAQCHCGRYMANTHPIVRTRGEGYSWAEYVADVRGDCSRCGPDQQAHRGDWHWSADAWNWGDDQ